MKQILGRCLLFFAFLMIGSMALAQNKAGKIYQMKLAFLTDKMNLSNSQAERFRPVYNSYEKELRHIRKQYRMPRGTRPAALTNEEAKKQIENNLAMQQALIDLRRKYQPEFLKIISPKQLVALYAAEKDFRQMLIKELRKRRDRR